MALKNVLFPPILTEQGVNLLGVVRAGLLVIAVALVGGGAWLAYAPLSGAVVANGVVKVDLNRKVVQHQEGGIVKEVLVRDGTRVREGQPLIVLQDVRVDAQLELVRKQLDVERVRAARLVLEQAYPAPLQFPQDLMERAKEPALAEVLAREELLHRARRVSLEEQLALYERQIKEVNDEAKALTSKMAAEEKGLQLQREELALNIDLARQNYVQRTRVIALERAVAEYESRREEHRAELARARQKVTDLHLKRLAAASNFRQQASDELKDANAKLLDLEERLRPSQDAARRQVIAAPAAGEVVNLQVSTPGAVIGPREVLAEIVPAEQPLMIEAQVRPEDINHVRVGVPADVRLTAYKQRTTPLVAGTVVYVSADRNTDTRTGQAYYVARVEVPVGALEEAGNLKLQAGMPAELYIRTDERTALDYLLAPITASLRRAVREPL
jgi:HlyD family type I secretion membrane fusion protein